VKTLLKTIVTGLFLCIAFPIALLSGFGRIRAVYLTGAHMVAVAPGILGDYLRAAFYHLTLRSCSLRSRISFGVIFSNPDATVGLGAYIGAYCVLGRVRIGEHVQIASLVQVISGSKQHGRDEHGNLMTGEAGVFEAVSIGANAWVGAAAIVMADVGEKSTIGAGSVVTKPVPAGVVAVGNPARVRSGNSDSV